MTEIIVSWYALKAGKLRVVQVREPVFCRKLIIEGVRLLASSSH